MNILVLNGQTKSHAINNSDFGEDLDRVKNGLLGKGHVVESYNLNNLALNDCIGCYSCWLKTPGICVWKDDMPSILIEFLKSDVVVIASPINMGFISSLAKRFKDRQLPLVHPFLKMNGDRMGHIMRYNKQPRQVFLLDKEKHSEHIAAIYEKDSDEKKVLFYMTDEL